MPGKDNDMAGKDFEQQIREGLQDWTMAPADQVRSAVLERVGRQRRRRALLWVPLGLLLLGLFVGGAFWLTSVRSRQTAAQGVGAAAGAPVGPLATEPPGTPAKDPTGIPAKEPVRALVPGRRQESAGRPWAAGQVNDGVSGTGSSEPTAPSASARLAAPLLGATRLAAPLPGSARLAASLPGASAPIVSPDGPLTLEIPGNDGFIYALSTSTEYLYDLPRDKEAALLPFRPLPVLPATAAHPSTQESASSGNKNGFQVYVAAGASAQGSFLRFHTPARISRFSAASLLGLSANSGQSGDTLANSVSKPGITLGVSWLWRLSEHWGAGLGLEFDSWETVFSPVQGNGSYSAPGVATVSTYGYYTAGYGSSVTNRYRLLQLPIDISWHIAPRRAWNPTLYLGLSPSHLLVGKGLVYIPDGSGYEKDASLYRHWSLSGVSGFRADVVHLGKYRLQVGPVLQYDLINLQKNAPVSDHLNYMGITLGVFRPWK